MIRLLTALAVRLRDDRGEVGPIGYAIIVSGVVLLAILVVGWGENIAKTFMEDVQLGDGGGGD